MTTDAPCIELPRYKSHKEVWALKIARIDGTKLVFEDERYAPINAGNEYLDKHDPKPGGYYVVYKDGYKSWSPAEAFEDGHTLISDLPGNRFVEGTKNTAAVNSYGAVFSVGDKVKHESQGDEVAEILSLKLSDKHAPEIEAMTSQGTAHLDYLIRV